MKYLKAFKYLKKYEKKIDLCHKKIIKIYNSI